MIKCNTMGQKRIELFDSMMRKIELVSVEVELKGIENYKMKKEGIIKCNKRGYKRM